MVNKKQTRFYIFPLLITVAVFMFWASYREDDSWWFFFLVMGILGLNYKMFIRRHPNLD